MKANYLSLISKGIAAVLVLSAAIASMLGVAIDMLSVIQAATFIAASFITVDISKIKTSVSGG